ncbi:hypothetical protein ACHAXR_005256, partial [Thalassiosira sp. AJA248-18]
MYHNSQKTPYAMNLPKAFFFAQLCAVAFSTSLRGDSKSRELVDTTDTRIIGGTEAIEDRYSYAVSLEINNRHFCGGSLVAPNIVLSAAHCMQSQAGYTAVVGRHALTDRDGYEAIVLRQIRHPRYDSRFTDNDYMILILDRYITGVKLVEVSPNFSREDVAVTVMGWGDTNPASNYQSLANKLKEIDVLTMSNDECSRSSGIIGGQSIFGYQFGGSQTSYAGLISENMLCARDNGEDSCQGDSGGPMVIKGDTVDYQVGVVSWGMGCAHPEFP